MDRTIPLSAAEIGKKCIIEHIAPGLGNADRLRELGFTAGTAVTPVHSAPLGGDPRAYFIRGTVMALRNEDAAHIAVKIPEEGEKNER